MKALIVCRDERADHLSAILSESFEVFAIKLDNKYRYNSDEARLCGSPVIPNEYEILFFHTGMSDPGRIPENIRTSKEFSFNTPGRPPDISSRLNAFKILRGFNGTSCPITEKNLQEFVDFINGSRTAVPSICQPSNNTCLIAFSILCQGYLAAHGGNGLDQAWERLPKNCRERVEFKKAETEQPSWWSCIDSAQLIDEIDYNFSSDDQKEILLELISSDSASQKIEMVSDVKKAYDIVSLLFKN
jgi:hypothetical protein